MSNQPRDEMEEIERQFEQIIEGLIPLLPTDDQTKIIRKEANRREKVRIEVRAAKAKEDELNKQREAFEAERKRQGERRSEEWRQLVAELERLLANVPEARPLLRRMTELLSGREAELPGNAEGLWLQKKIDKRWLEFQTTLEKELEELAEKMISLSAPDQQVEIKNAMAEHRAETIMSPPHIDFVTGAYSSRLLYDVLTWETARADRHDYPLTM